MATKTVTVEASQLGGFAIEARSRQHISIIDQPQAGGGKDEGPTPLEYLFVSLAGCIISIGLIIARQRKLAVRSIGVRIEGDLDTDVLMGKSSEARAGFSAIRVFTKVDADMSQAEKEQFLHEIDARCPISDNILNQTSIELIVE